MRPLAAEAGTRLPGRRRSRTSGSRARRTSTPTGSPTRRWTRARGASSGRPSRRRAALDAAPRRPRRPRPAKRRPRRGRRAPRRQAARSRRPPPPRPRRTAQARPAAADLGAPTTFVLLRHGETPLTPEKRFSGSGGTDPELSDAGPPAGRARPPTPSPPAAPSRRSSAPRCARCRQTAAAVAARLGPDGPHRGGPARDGLRGLGGPDLRRGPGALPRRPGRLARLRRRPPRPAAARASRRSPAGSPPPATSSSPATPGRRCCWSRTSPRSRPWSGSALGAPPESLFRMELSAASLSAVAYYADGNASLRLLNDTSHLR